MLTKLKERLKLILPDFAYRPSLRNRVLLIIVGASLIIVLVSAWLSFRYQREQLINSAQATTETLSNAILANLKHAMLTVDWDMLNESVQDVAAAGAVEALRIMDHQGFVYASSIGGEIGARFNQEDPLCPQSNYTKLLFQSSL